MLSRSNLRRTPLHTTPTAGASGARSDRKSRNFARSHDEFLARIHRIGTGRSAPHIPAWRCPGPPSCWRSRIVPRATRTVPHTLPSHRSRRPAMSAPDKSVAAPGRAMTRVGLPCPQRDPSASPPPSHATGSMSSWPPASSLRLQPAPAPDCRLSSPSPVRGILLGSVPRLLTRVRLSVGDLLIGIFSGRVCFGLVFLLPTRLWLILLVRMILRRAASGE